MRDIENRDDIENLVNSFYEHVRNDEIIGHFFTKIVNVNWESHLPKMYDFWESLIFTNGVYRGNPMLKHLDLNKKSPLNKEHFAHWLKLWQATLTALYKGPNTNIAYAKAEQIAGLIQYKVEHMKSGKYIQ